MYRPLDLVLSNPALFATHYEPRAVSLDGGDSTTLEHLHAGLVQEGLLPEAEAVPSAADLVRQLPALQSKNPQGYARAVLGVADFRAYAKTEVLVGLAASLGSQASALHLLGLTDRRQALAQISALLGVHPKDVAEGVEKIESAEKISFATGSLGDMPMLEEIIENILQRLPAQALLDYSDPQGLPLLREAIAALHNSGRDNKIRGENVLITTSAEQALDITFGELAKTPRVLFLQQPAFFGIHRLLKKYPEFKVVPFEKTAELSELVKKCPGAAVYLSSNYHYAQGSLSDAEKMQLAAWAREYELHLIEDNPYDFLGYTETNPLRIQELAPDHTVYIGSFSKILAPGIRLGYMMTPEGFKSSLKSAKIDRDLFTATSSQHMALAALAPANRGYIRDLSRIMQERVQTVLGLMDKHLSDLPGVTWTRPAGGLFINITLPAEIDMEAFMLLAERDFGLKLESDRFCYWDKKTRHTTRINGVQNASPQKTEEGLIRFKQAYLALQKNEHHKSGEETSVESFIPLDVVITSGGTITYIDTVRTVGNISGGKTGARIAEEFLRRGHRVYFIHRKGSSEPFEDAFEMPRGDYTPEERALREAEMNARWREFQKHAARLNMIAYDDFDDYLHKVKQWVSRPETDVFVSAAAVSDYGTQAVDHKIRSDGDGMTINLGKLPKVIAEIKRGEKWNEHVFLVSFKLLTGVDIPTLIDEAYRAGIKIGANLMVGNSAAARNFGDRRTVLITPEKNLMPVATNDVAREVVRAVEQRHSHRHYKTVLAVNEDFATHHADEIAAFRDDVRRLWELDIFEPYLEGEKMDFGFYAKRLGDGSFLITARASDKKDLPDADIVRITQVDFDKRVIHAESLGKKPSLNTNIAAKIFAERPEIKVVMHAHVTPGFAKHTSTDYAPGTEEDLQEVWRHLRDGTKALELKGHGIMVLGADSAEIMRQMTVEPAYTTQSAFYDMMYGRFQGENTADLVALIKNTFGRDERILDLAGGTGDLTCVLRREGFTQLALADRSMSMAGVAAQKFTAAGYEIPIYQASMTTIHEAGINPDGIVIRQAINYLMTREGLLAGLKSMHAALKPGGRLVFNAPAFNPDRLIFPDRENHYRFGGYDVRVHERNTVRDGILIHGQRTRAISDDGLTIHNLYDLNHFGVLTKDDFAWALREAGFVNVQFFGKGLAEYSDASKTLYVLAVKK